MKTRSERITVIQIRDADGLNLNSRTGDGEKNELIKNISKRKITADKCE